MVKTDDRAKKQLIGNEFATIVIRELGKSFHVKCEY